MSSVEVYILALALAIDSMLISFSYGLILDKKRMLNSLLLAGAFGLFQGLMPLAGFYLTDIFYSSLEVYSKWIVFFIFMFLGIKFLKSAFEKKEEVKIVCISFCCLLFLAIATSIDALGAGISFKLLNLKPFYPSFVIAVVTFILSFFGFWVTSIFKNLPSRPVEVFGAVLLIYLAVKAILF